MIADMRFTNFRQNLLITYIHKHLQTYFSIIPSNVYPIYFINILIYQNRVSVIGLIIFDTL